MMTERFIFIVGTKGTEAASALLTIAQLGTSVNDLGITMVDLANSVEATTTAVDELRYTFDRMDYDRPPDRHDFWNISGDHDKYRRRNRALTRTAGRLRSKPRPRQVPSGYG